MEIFDILTRRMEEALQSDNVEQNVWNVFDETLNYLDSVLCRVLDNKEEFLDAKYKFFEAVDQLQEMHQKYDELEAKYNELVGR